jgi:hypothetical protein
MRSMWMLVDLNVDICYGMGLGYCTEESPDNIRTRYWQGYVQYVQYVLCDDCIVQRGMDVPLEWIRISWRTPDQAGNKGY